MLNAIFIDITNHELDFGYKSLLNPYDAIVVGSGATGGIAALTLAELGKKVLVIEAGPQIKRKEAINDEPKATFNRLSGLLSKKHAKQSQHPGYWKNNPINMVGDH